MRLKMRVLAALVVAVLLVVPTSAVLANGIFMPDIGQMKITPAAAAVGEKITIDLMTANDSIDTAGTLAVVLKINGVVEQETEVKIEPQDQVPVSFTVSRDVPGTYKVVVGDGVNDYVEGTFTVGGGTAPATTGPATTAPTAPATTGPATTAATTAAAAGPAPTGGEPIVVQVEAIWRFPNWLVMLGQAVGVIVALGFIDYLIRTRNRRQTVPGT
ncbi:MAG TPA: hypothetical protein VJL08_01905 [Dehalococcoidia bacterium]|nr:hypothetical protein [Dehalococcoidia bacterium]